MTYMFRVRFKVGPNTRIGAQVTELILGETNEVRVFLRSRVEGQLVNDADQLEMRGEGYTREAEAEAEGKRWISALTLGTISELVGIEFSERSAPNFFTQAVLEWVKPANPDAQAYPDITGLQVVPQSPPPVFVRAEANGIGFKNGDAIAAHARETYGQEADPDKRSLLACEMYAASHFMPSDDSRFLMLMIAVEALIETGNRSAEQMNAIEGLIDHLASLSLPEGDRQSLAQTLNGLKKESINSAAKRLAAVLGSQPYGEKSPKRFFRDCYNARSALVHGSLERPAAETIRELIWPLEYFVRDLVLKHNGVA
ncbi:hypothetical protein [Arthrobacter sp. ZBG10]|uniref:hypothetical protein n=1 Tax=Arthrobacter sp. ZBG10 TaxID=1676590 RepID=UPI000B1F81AF|nr:hypothetical protein [Arthrobacter sp. ZBG10]